MGTSEKLSCGSKLPPTSKDLELRELGFCLHWLSFVLEKTPRQLLKNKIFHVPSGMDSGWTWALCQVCSLRVCGVGPLLATPFDSLLDGLLFFPFIYFVILFLIVVGVGHARQVPGIEPRTLRMLGKLSAANLLPQALGMLLLIHFGVFPHLHCRQTRAFPGQDSSAGSILCLEEHLVHD